MSSKTDPKASTPNIDRILSRTIFLYNIHKSTDETYLRSMLSVAGPLEKLQRTNENFTRGFVIYADESSARSALNMFRGDKGGYKSLVMVVKARITRYILGLLKDSVVPDVSIKEEIDEKEVDQEGIDQEIPKPKKVHSKNNLRSGRKEN